MSSRRRFIVSVLVVLLSIFASPTEANPFLLAVRAVRGSSNPKAVRSAFIVASSGTKQDINPSFINKPSASSEAGRIEGSFTDDDQDSPLVSRRVGLVVRL